MQRLSAKERCWKNCVDSKGRCGYLEIVVDRAAGEVSYYCLGNFKECTSR